MESQYDRNSNNLAEYFVVAGLPEKDPELLENCIPAEMEPPQEFKSIPPIIELAIIFRSLGEEPPPGFVVIENTPTGYPADLNHGSLRSPNVYLCYKRGREKPPIVDIGVMYEGKERVMPGCEILLYSPYGRPANVNNSGARTYITYRRAYVSASPNELTVSDICVVLLNKGERPPHAFMLINKNLNKGMVGSDVFICYKKSMSKTNLISYKPALLSRYPETNLNDYLLPDITPLFCLPMGATLEKWDDNTKIPDPLFSTFVLTNYLAIKAYGAAIVFYEPYDIEKLSHDQRQRLMIDDSSNLRTKIPLNSDLSSKPSNKELFKSCNGGNEDVNQYIDENIDSDYSNRVLKSDSPFYNGDIVANDYNKTDFPDLSSESENEKKINQQKNQRVIVYSNKAISIVSKWPLFTIFKKFLHFLYNVTLSGSSKIPIERYISFFMHKIPFPSQSRPQILVQLPFNTTLSLIQTFNIPMGITGASFVALIQNLSSDNILNLMCAILLENKILLHSLRPSVLTGVGEALRMLIFPLQWQCSYIPLCPILLSQVLNAPVPYIIGVDSRYFEMFQHSPMDAVTVDLDTNTLIIPEHKKIIINSKNLPKKSCKIMRHAHFKIMEYLEVNPEIISTRFIKSRRNSLIDDDFKRVKLQEVIERSIQDTFLRFMACLLKGYQRYLMPLTKTPNQAGYEVKHLFDFGGFLRSRDRSCLPFFTGVTETQMFCQFIQDRSFVTTKDSHLTFFDEISERVDPSADKDDQSFLRDMNDETLNSDYTVYIPPPDTIGLPQGMIYKYTKFPELDPTLFYLPDLIDSETSTSNLIKQDGAREPPESPIDEFGSNVAIPPKHPSLQSTTPLSSNWSSNNRFNENSCTSSPCKGSPLITRTKQEIKSGKKIAQINFDNPVFKARFLLNSCFSIWFLYLPAYVKFCQNKRKALYCALEILTQIPKTGIKFPNELCYRILLQLCGIYNESLIAVRVLKEMRRLGLHPNAVTYGYYNKAVFESDSNSTNLSAQISWAKIKNVVIACGHFKRSCPYFYTYSRRTFDLIKNNKSNINIAYGKGVDNNKQYDNTDGTYKHRKQIRNITASYNGGQMEISGYYSEPEVTIPRPKIQAFNSEPNLSNIKQDICVISSSEKSQPGNDLTPADHPNISTTFSNISKTPPIRKSNTESPIAKMLSRRLDSFLTKLDNALLVHYPPSLSSSNSLLNSNADIPNTSIVLNNNTMSNISNVTTDVTTHNNSFSLPPSDNFNASVNKTPFSRHRLSLPQDGSWASKLSMNSSNAPYDKLSDNIRHTNQSHIIPDNPTTALMKSAAGLVGDKIKKFIATASDQYFIADHHKTDYIPDNKSIPENQCNKYSANSSKPSFFLADRVMWADYSAFYQGHIEAALAKHPNYKSEDEQREFAIRSSDNYSDDVSLNFDTNAENVSISNQNISCYSKPLQSMGNENLWDLEKFEGSKLHKLDKNNPYLLSILKELVLQSGNVDSLTTAVNERYFRSDERDGQTGKHVVGPTKLKSLSHLQLSAMQELIAPNLNISNNSPIRKIDQLKPVSTDPKLNGKNSHKRTLSYQNYMTFGSERLNRANSCRFSSSISSIINKEAGLSIINGNDRLKSERKVPIKKVNRITMSTCMACPHCHLLIYDEDIIMGWYPDESNLNTKCRYCKKNFVPTIRITLKEVDYSKIKQNITFLRKFDRLQSAKRQLSQDKSMGSRSSSNLCDGSESLSRHSLSKNQSSSTASQQFASYLSSFTETTQNIHNLISLTEYICGAIKGSDKELNDTQKIDHSKEKEKVQNDKNTKADSSSCIRNGTEAKDVSDQAKSKFKQPYLSPLVLQKELENILEHEGNEECLLDPSFVDHHACVYWNLLWYFNRFKLPSFLSDLTLKHCFRAWGDFNDNEFNDKNETMDVTVKDKLEERETENISSDISIGGDNGSLGGKNGNLAFKQVSLISDMIKNFDDSYNTGGKDTINQRFLNNDDNEIFAMNIPEAEINIFKNNPSSSSLDNISINVISDESQKQIPLEILALWDDLDLYIRENTKIPLYLHQYLYQNELHDILKSITSYPLHTIVDERDITQCLEAISKNDLFMALLPILFRLKNEGGPNISNTSKNFNHQIKRLGLYREILWLSLLLHNKLNYEAFDYEYKRAFNKIKHEFSDLLQPDDMLNIENIFVFQKYFCKVLCL
ncbi:C-myc promoter-binding protein-like isoform X4 [Gordionus sp. m RMFG-2023]|uniref:C-myc promoter-binding protein-like isoform X4 n=1 Tax=Gordionus sp. m RMFG-2023 TaxID=3053472 RepID=UPI0031FD62D0